MTGYEHLDVDTLAELAAGLLDTHQAEAARAHLTDCAACSRRAGDLVRTSEVLAAASRPRMPVDVAARLDAALAAEARARAVRTSAEGQTPTVSARDGSVVPLARRRRRKRLAATVAVAASAVVLAGGVVGVRAFQGAEPQRTSASRAQGSGAGDATRKDAQVNPPDQNAEAAEPVTASGRDYSSRELPGQVAELLRDESKKPQMGTQELKPTPRPLRSLATPATLAHCVTHVAGNAGTPPLAVDLARYAGEPAAVIVVPSTRPDKASVWVVDPSCSHVRLHAEVARGG